jgi:hypothetical protein
MNGLPLRADPLHEAAIERAMVEDRARQDRGELRWIRPAFAHEACPESGPCFLIDAVIVTVIERGLRTREPVTLTGGQGTAA